MLVTGLRKGSSSRSCTDLDHADLCSQKNPRAVYKLNGNIYVPFVDLTTHQPSVSSCLTRLDLLTSYNLGQLSIVVQRRRRRWLGHVLRKKSKFTIESCIKMDTPREA